MVTTNDPDDSTAIEIGRLYIDMKNKFTTDFNTEIDRIKAEEKAEAYRGTYPADYFYLLFSLHDCILFRIKTTRTISK